MIYCCITIDYLSQLERSGVKEAGAFIDELRAIASDFGAAIGPRKWPLLVGFRYGGMFDGIETAEALDRIAVAMAKAEPYLRGASLVVHDAQSAEEALAAAVSMRYRDCAAYSYTFTAEATAALSAYFDFGAEGSGWIAPIHRSSLADADARGLFERPRLLETVVRTASQSERRGPRLVHLEAGPGTRAIDALASLVQSTGSPTLVIGGSRARAVPFSPVIEAIAAERSRQGQKPENDRDELAFKYLAASSFSGGAPESVAKGCEAYIGRWLDAHGDAGGLIVCDAPERFSPEVLALIAKRLADGRGAERYLSISEGTLIESWAGPWAARVPHGMADADDRPAAVEAALGASEGDVREALKARFYAVAGGAHPESPAGIASGEDFGISKALRVLPEEASLYLYGLSISDNELTQAEFSEFYKGIGLNPAGEALILNLLSRAGLVEPGRSQAPLDPVDAAAIESAINPEAASVIKGRLASFLVGLYRAGRIRPSLGFLRRVGERPDEEALLYDCLYDEMLRPDRASLIDPGFLSPSSSSVYRFYTAMMRGDRNQSESAAVAAEERVTGPRAEVVRGLIRAEYAYSTGDADRSGKGARAAMLSLGKGAPPKLEARCQRMMGLSALAMDKYTEAIDYLTNAQEQSESAGDDYERMMMAAYSKAIVEFLLGSLVRSSKAADCAVDSASRLFRMDVVAAIEALRGRIDLELGAYDESARRFASLSAMAAEYSIAGAESRATIWRARALSYAREFSDAETMLESMADDPEARVFRGELEILRGRPRDARPWLEPAPEPMIRPFGPPDSFDWASLFSEVEGRCLGFESSDAPLAELRTALSLFARGLDERDPACAIALHDMTRIDRGSKVNPGIGTYGFFCYLLEERLAEPPIDKQTVLSRAFKTLQQRAGRIEDRAQRTLYMEKNAWNKRLIEAARTHKFI